MRDIYNDKVLGSWQFDIKASKKGTSFVFKRSAKVVLNKDDAVDYTNPENFKSHKAYGEIVLTETKMIDKQNSNESRFRGIELTENTQIYEVI